MSNIRTDMEIEQEILLRVQRINTKKSKMKKALLTTVSAIACFVLVAVVAVQSGIFSNGNYIPPNENSETQGIPLVKFKASPLDPDVDSLIVDDDGLPYVIFNINIREFYRYYQIDPKDYEKYGIGSKLEKSDFGDLIGEISEYRENSQNNFITSDDESIIGASVYAYTPIPGKGLVIVKGKDCCNLFLLHEYEPEDGLEALSFSNLYSLFEIDSADEIESLEYSFRKYVGFDLVRVDKGVITDKDKIAEFYEISAQLGKPVGNEPYPNDLLNDGYVGINIQIHLKNGIIMGNEDSFMMGINFYYKAGANGYLDYCASLTPEQSLEMRNIFVAN